MDAGGEGDHTIRHREQKNEAVLYNIRKIFIHTVIYFKLLFYHRIAFLFHFELHPKLQYPGLHTSTYGNLINAQLTGYTWLHMSCSP